jgi:hypothetical protein
MRGRRPRFWRSHGPCHARLHEWMPRRRCASATMMLASTAKASPPTIPSVMQRPTTISNSLRKRSLGRKRPWRFLEKVDDRGRLPLHARSRRHRGQRPRPASPAAAFRAFRGQRIPASISSTRPPIVCGVTTPAPVFSDSPGILYFADSTHCTTGMKPCRYSS